MLITTDLVRDVFANEIIELAKCIDDMTKSIDDDIKSNMKQHIANMTNIVIKDFTYIPDDIRIWEIHEMAEAIVRKRGNGNGETYQTGGSQESVRAEVPQGGGNVLCGREVEAQGSQGYGLC